ncbi:hypothetical protein [Aquincola tertiaricarbonis]|uniref:hypothetical protein n=1 Tax=Aquincola tertiaricarbonis TaxID=391953 RepID=UPI0012ECF54F|nr:hypothetical protein [Aquincola tertiaricarbonis]
MRKSKALAVPPPIWIEASRFDDVHDPDYRAALLAQGVNPLSQRASAAGPCRWP